MHGDEAVAALERELVDPYRARPVRDCSLNDSDGTEISNSFQLMIFVKIVLYFVPLLIIICHVYKCRLNRIGIIDYYYYVSKKGTPTLRNVFTSF